MFSLNKWVLRHPTQVQFLYLLSLLVFFTRSSFADGRLYLEAGLLCLGYGIWLRPFCKLIGYDLERKGLNRRSRFQKILLLNGSWIFLLIPIKLAVIDTLSHYQSMAVVNGTKVLILMGVLAVILVRSVQGFSAKDKLLRSAMAWSLVKNFLILFLIPFLILLISPVLILVYFSI